MKIAQRYIDEAKHIDSQEVAAQLGLQRAKGADRNKYVCPFCPSSNALQVYPKGRGEGAHCFSCHTACSDNINFVQSVRDCDFREAVEFLVNSSDIYEESEPRNKGGDAPHIAPVQPDVQEDGITPTDYAKQEREAIEWTARREAVGNLLHGIWERLTLSDAATDYLEERGISREVAEAVGIRSANGEAWHELKGEADEQVWADAGFTNHKGNPHPWYKDTFLVYPYRRSDGAIRALRFRRARPGEKTISACGTDYNETIAPFGMAAHPVEHSVRNRRPLYVVEGELDAVSVMIAGRWALGAPGATIWRPEWCEGWDRLSTVVVAGDRDHGGDSLIENVIDHAADRFGARWVESHIFGVNLGDRHDEDGEGEGTADDANALLQEGRLRAVINTLEQEIKKYRNPEGNRVAV